MQMTINQTFLGVEFIGMIMKYMHNISVLHWLLANFLFI